MKKLLLFTISTLVLVFIIFTFTGNSVNTEYLRIHIRANSNLEIDQNVKYQIKDKVVEYMIPFISSCETKEEAEKEIKKHLEDIEDIADSVLKSKGFSYFSKAKLVSEEFPTRVYGDLTLESGFYDALILELGEAKGDNWWCVVYPPLCFLQSNPKGDYVVYKSKILEIIQSNK